MLAALVLVFAFLDETISSSDYSIYVISTNPSAYSSSGRLHKETIQCSFSSDLQFKIRNYNIKIFYKHEDPNFDRAAFIKSLSDDRVIAILGPVTSGYSEKIIEALNNSSISIPVISSFSTNYELHDSDTKKIFYRTVPDDAKRITELIEFTGLKSYRADIVVFYSENKFGKGLKKVFEKYFSKKSSKRNGIVDSFYPINQNTKERVEGNSEEFKKNHVFIFTSDPNESLGIYDLLEHKNPGKNIKYYFVGNKDDYRHKIRAGTVIASLPTIAFKDCKTNSQDGSLSWGAYVAAEFLKEAITYVFNDTTNETVVDDVRLQIKNALDNRITKFEGRELKFINGELENAEANPIYVSQTTWNQKNKKEKFRVKIEVPNMEFFSSPFKLQFICKGGYEGKVFVEIKRDKGYFLSKKNEKLVIVYSKELDIKNGYIHEFHPKFFGPHTVEVKTNKNRPSIGEKSFKVKFPWSYIVALLGSIAAMLVRKRYKSNNLKLLDFIVGIFSGWILLFLTTYGHYLFEDLGQFLPRFGKVPWANASLCGIFGGWFELALIHNQLEAIFGAKAQTGLHAPHKPKNSD